MVCLYSWDCNVLKSETFLRDFILTWNFVAGVTEYYGVEAALNNYLIYGENQDSPITGQFVQYFPLKWRWKTTKLESSERVILARLPELKLKMAYLIGAAFMDIKLV